MSPPRARADLIPPNINRKWAWHYHALLQLQERLLNSRSQQSTEVAEALPDSGSEPIDRASDESALDVAYSILAKEEGALAEVQAALQRLHRGTYGRCEASGKRIAPARLRALPWCRRTTAAETARQRLPHFDSKPHAPAPARSRVLV